ncbi:MAG TPA: hypothetical protein VEK15_10445, partial [Vicinamibacteria bacterium]|nr:hypothetical protein [Vicinamibacteria bacterium]
MRVGKTLLLTGALAGTVVLGRGVLLIQYEPETSNAYVWGAFHVHSTLSDGLSSLEEIADAAREARVGFVMLSEHGSPHPEATTLSRTIRGVRFIGGSEIGLPEGHLIASDARSLPEYKLPPYPPDATADIREWGGLSVITYPEDPTQRWSYWEDDLVPDGIEIINVTSYFRASSAAAKLKWALYSPFNRYYYIEAFTSPSYA